MKAIRELGIFTGVVLIATLLFNIASIQAFQVLQESWNSIRDWEFMYSFLFFCECFFFIALGIGLIYFSLFPTTETERYTYRPIGDGRWIGERKRVRSLIELSERDVQLRLIKGGILIIIGAFFLHLFLQNIHVL